MFNTKQKIFWFLMLFFPIFSFASSIWPECIASIEDKFEEIQDKKTLLDSKVYKNKNFSWEKKSEIISYNYRNYKCSLEAICWAVESFIFYKWESTFASYNNSLVWCWNVSLKDINFQSCASDIQNRIKQFTDITKICNDLIWQKVLTERSRMVQEFEIYSMQNKSYFLSAKLLSINIKMRSLALSMTKLRTLLERIIDKVTCFQP